MEKINYQVTVGYRAVVCFDVKAESEAEAKEIVLKMVKEDGVYAKKATIQDEVYGCHGVVDLDKTWYMLNN